MKKPVLLIMILGFGLLSQCSKEEIATPQKLTGSWSPYWGFLFHDGHPYESDNFII